jgi:hypothetical protein
LSTGAAIGATVGVGGEETGLDARDFRGAGRGLRAGATFRDLTGVEIFFFRRTGAGLRLFFFAVMTGEKLSPRRVAASKLTAAN